MAFRCGETVTIDVEVKNKTGTKYVDPDTSMKINIYDSQNGVIIEDADMTKDSVGHYHYDFQTASLTILGKFTYVAVATDGTRLTYHIGYFEIY